MPEKHLAQLMERYPELQPVQQSIRAAYEILSAAYADQKKALLCGNGGSSADAEHVVGELMKGFLLPRNLSEAQTEAFTERYGGAGEYLARRLQGALPAISLGAHAALISAFANDVAADMVYAQQVYGYGQPGDILLAFSTSGNSVNVVNAVKVANVLSLKSVGLTGARGGRLLEECTCCICLPATETARVQELTLPVYHALCAMLEARFFG
ncbi:MAG: SIS domain-containing protein [Clostridiales bacterium]|jgi:D-sedoheptulose 7-phosphate isomerase|nr:SIS domain-containing protein [Clostridiales bacterium]